MKDIFNLGTVNNIQSTLKGGVKAIFGIVILWVGTMQVLDGNISIGTLLTFNALLAYFLNPIENMVNFQSTLQSAVVAAQRLEEINPSLAQEAKKVLEKNKEERHIRGGMATKRKYEAKKV